MILIEPIEDYFSEERNLFRLRINCFDVNPLFPLESLNVVSRFAIAKCVYAVLV